MYFGEEGGEEGGRGDGVNGGRRRRDSLSTVCTNRQQRVKSTTTARRMTAGERPEDGIGERRNGPDDATQRVSADERNADSTGGRG